VSTALALGLAVLAALCAWRERFLWKHDRHALDAGHLYARHGWLAPSTTIASRLKLQSIELEQGPLARRHGYATVHFGVAGGHLAMAGVPVEEARAIRSAVLDTLAPVDFSRA
jgi:putative membrane protein